jgi:tetratricopeptide (TPR) repeat protein
MVEITEKAGGSQSPELPHYLGLWAKALYVERQYDKAEALLERAVWILDKQETSSEPQLIQILDVYAPVLRKAGQTRQADAMQARADALAARNRDVQRFTDSVARSYRRESIVFALLDAGDFLMRLLLVALVIIVLGFLFLRECG